MIVDQVEDQEVNHLLLIMVDLQMADLQIVEGEPVLQEVVALLHAVTPMAEEVAAMTGAEVLLHAAEALPETGDVKKVVLLQEADEALAKGPKEK